MKKMKKLIVLLMSCSLLTACSSSNTLDVNDNLISQTSTEIETTEELKSEEFSSKNENVSSNAQTSESSMTHLENTISSNMIPEHSADVSYIVINDNVPYFSEAEKTTEAFEKYSELDSLGRCGVAYANICQEIMPTGQLPTT